MEKEKKDKIATFAAQFISAEITNGNRSGWMFQMSEEKTEDIIDHAIYMAETMLNKIEKLTDESDIDPMN